LRKQRLRQTKQNKKNEHNFIKFALVFGFILFLFLFDGCGGGG